MADLQTCSVRTAPTLSTHTVRLLELQASSAVAALNLAAAMGTVILIAAAPSADTDFSMFTGAVAPTTGCYLAMTPTALWYFRGGWTSWRHAIGMLST